MITIDFLLTSIIVVLIPGTGVLFTVSIGLSHGRKASVYAALGCTAGIIPHLLATVLGLAVIMHTSAMAFQLVKYAGAIYLLYLAYLTWKDRSGFKLEGQGADVGARWVLKACFLNILNPKLSIFFMAFLPQFITVSGLAATYQLVLLSSVFMLMTFVVFVSYGLLAHAFRQKVIQSKLVQCWLRRTFSAAFAGLGIQLAFAEK
jgi:threonine/homoserine/homoserine lactone efflux protein